ncbi:hypothetical protein LTR49_023567 [Elasticomyces elasticus]|nr:hypothetical protein LTR49_023567 [Elasticomyces elasticus]
MGSLDNLDSAIALSENVQQVLKCGLSSSQDEQKELRKNVCALAKELWLELEESGDLVDRIIYGTQENAILRLGLDLGIYKLLAENKRALDSRTIAMQTGANLVLVERVMRNLAGLGHVEERGENAFAANKFTRAFNSDKGITGLKFSYDFAAPAWNQIPGFLKARGYRNPTDPMDTPLQRAFQPKEHFFPLMVQQNVLADFQGLMSSYRTDRAEFLDVFPAEQHLIEGFQVSETGHEVLMVDIGGGRGHELLRVAEKFPATKGRLILQDLPDVIEQALQSDRIELMAYDFFTPQPVKGARAYYYRMIFHDWPDTKCADILNSVASAMEPGYSKLIINDIVLPNQGASRFAVQSDMNMLALLASMERSDTQWHRLLASAGFEDIKIWPGTPESVIEAKLKLERRTS